MARPVLSRDRDSYRIDHRILWSAQRTVTAWDQVADFVGIRTTEKLLQPFIVLRRSWACPEVLNHGKGEIFSLAIK